LSKARVSDELVTKGAGNLMEIMGGMEEKERR